MSDNTRFLVETTAESFERDVFERSAECPVVVDFWAEWCGPCRLLGPILERLAHEYGGRFVLVKANTEELPGQAAAFRVRSIPAVFGVRDGKIVDSFVGVLSEPAIRAFLDRLLPSPADLLAREARGLETSDPGRAEAKYREALELAPSESEAKIGLARVLTSGNRWDEAQALIDDLELRGYLEPEAERLKAQLTLRPPAGGLDEARAAAAAHPDDLNLQLRLAETLAAAGAHVEALDLCLDLVERDRKGVGEPARKTMLALFKLVDDEDLVSEYQRKLAAALF
jgi:putative thioredoxin